LLFWDIQVVVDGAKEFKIKPQVMSLRLLIPIEDVYLEASRDIMQSL